MSDLKFVPQKQEMNFIRGDAFSFGIVLKNKSDGSTIDWSDGDVTLKILKPNSTDVVMTKKADHTDSENGVGVFNMTEDNTDLTPGRYDFRLILTKPSIVRTFISGPCQVQ